MRNPSKDALLLRDGLYPFHLKPTMPPLSLYAFCCAQRYPKIQLPLLLGGILEKKASDFLLFVPVYSRHVKQCPVSLLITCHVELDPVRPKDKRITGTGERGDDLRWHIGESPLVKGGRGILFRVRVLGLCPTSPDL